MTINQTRGLSEITCRKCGVVKPATEFYLTPAGYPRRICKVCSMKDMKSYEQEKLKESESESRERRYGYAIKCRFNLTLTEFKQKLEEQNYVCAICHKSERDPKRFTLSVDHDRSCCAGYKSCGECVRGLLCSTCNTGIGLLQDSPELLASAIAYLDKYATKE